MTVNDIIICILAGIGILVIVAFIVWLAAKILAEMDKLK